MGERSTLHELTVGVDVSTGIGKEKPSARTVARDVSNEVGESGTLQELTVGKGGTNGVWWRGAHCAKNLHSRFASKVELAVSEWAC